MKYFPNTNYMYTPNGFKAPVNILVYFLPCLINVTKCTKKHLNIIAQLKLNIVKFIFI